MKPSLDRSLQRRECIALGMGSLLAPLTAMPVRAEVLNLKTSQLLAMQLQPEGVHMEITRMADTSASVPLQVQVQAPEGLKVQTVDVYLPENPLTLAVKWRLVEPQVRFAFSTRLRLAASQRVWVVATLSDDSRRGTNSMVDVVSSSCFDGS